MKKVTIKQFVSSGFKLVVGDKYSTQSKVHTIEYATEADLLNRGLECEAGFIEELTWRNTKRMPQKVGLPVILSVTDSKSDNGEINETTPVSLQSQFISSWKPDLEELAFTEKHCITGSGVERNNLGSFTNKVPKKSDSAFDSQVGGDHYKTLGIQPMELTYLNLGYLAFSGACYTKINKYITRKKDDEVEQLKKARHVLDMWIEKAEVEKQKS